MGGCLGKKNLVDDGGTDEQRRATRTKSLRPQKSMRNPGTIMLEAEMKLGMEENPMSMYQQVDPEPSQPMPTYVDVGATAHTAPDYMDMSGDSRSQGNYVNTQIGSHRQQQLTNTQPTQPGVLEVKYDSVDPNSFGDDPTTTNTITNGQANGQHPHTANYSVVNKLTKAKTKSSAAAAVSKTATNVNPLISAGVQAVEYEAMGTVNQPPSSSKARTDTYIYSTNDTPAVKTYDEVIPDGVPSVSSTTTLTLTPTVGATTTAVPPPQTKKTTQSRKEIDRCWNCKKFGPENVAMKVCGACRTARYCSKACQVTHWTKTHVKECGNIVEPDKKPGKKKHKYMNSDVGAEIEVNKQRYVNTNVRVENTGTSEQATQPPTRQKSTYQNIDPGGRVIKKSRYVNSDIAVLQATRDAEAESES